jgi:hypothetical protein
LHSWRLGSHRRRVGPAQLAVAAGVARRSPCEDSPGPYDGLGETAAPLDYAAQCHALSQGRFDITSGVLRRCWTFSRDLDGRRWRADNVQARHCMGSFMESSRSWPSAVRVSFNLDRSVLDAPHDRDGGVRTEAFWMPCCALLTGNTNDPRCQFAAKTVAILPTGTHDDCAALHTRKVFRLLKSSSRTNNTTQSRGHRNRD